MHAMKHLSSVVFLFLVTPLFSQITTSTYTFESLTVAAAIAGQDNWQYMGNLNTSNNIAGSLSCGIPSGAAPTQVATTTTSGAYTGGKAMRNPGTTGNSHGFASRINNAGWNYSIPATSDYLIFEFDYDNGNYWGQNVNLAFDRNGDGNFSSNCTTVDANEIGIGLVLGAATMSLYRANGTLTNAVRVGTGWTRYRITVDLRANSGQGSGSVCYRQLGTNGAWTTVTGLQNINMQISSASVNQNNLQNLNGIVVQQEAGGVGQVDNISVTTIRNTLLQPVSLCAGDNLNLTTLAIPSTSSYSWTYPNGSTTTATNSLTINNIALAGAGTYTVTTTDCTPLFWSITVTVCDPMPVELTAFDVNCQPDRVVLEWDIASELNNAYFTLEGSEDGLEFIQLAQVPGRGTTSVPKTYQYDAGNVRYQYYRLSQTDLNGDQEVLQLVSAGPHCFTDEFQFTVYPNPASDADLKISYQSPREETLALTFYDMSGKICLQTDMDISKGAGYKTVNIGALATGMYMVKFQSLYMDLPPVKIIRN